MAAPVRERFLAAYRAGLREAGAPIVWTRPPARVRARQGAVRVHLRRDVPAVAGCGRRPRACARCSTRRGRRGRADRVEALRADIERGPAALAALLDAYAAPAVAARPWIGDRSRRRVAFTGLGSSRYASMDRGRPRCGGGHPGLGRVRIDLGADAAGRRPGARRGLGFGTDARDRSRRRAGIAGPSRVIGVTNVPGLATGTRPPTSSCRCSPAARRPGSRRGRSGRRSRSWRCWPVGADSADRPSTACDRPSTLARRDRRAAIVAAGADAARWRAVDRCPRRRRRCSAPSQQAALMLREAPRLPAARHETADWLHTARLPRAARAIARCCSAGPPADAEVVDTIRRRGGETVVVGAPVEGALTIDPGRDGPLERAIVASVVAELAGAPSCGAGRRGRGRLRRLEPFGPASPERRPDLADPLDRLQVERVAEDDDDLADAVAPVASN